MKMFYGCIRLKMIDVMLYDIFLARASEDMTV